MTATRRRFFDPADPWGWPVTEYEESLELQPGLLHVAEQLLGVLEHLGHCRPAHGIARNKLRDNPCWPAELQERGAPAQERYVLLCRWPFRALRTTRAASAGRFSAAATRDRAGHFGGASHARCAANCRPSGPRISSAGCWRPYIRTPATAWPTSAARG